MNRKALAAMRAEIRSLPERRRHPRSPASGAVRLVIDDPQPVLVQGRLVDVSQSGFRASHNSVLETGREVRFEYAARQGTARVVWKRVWGGRIESGFFITG